MIYEQSSRQQKWNWEWKSAQSELNKNPMAMKPLKSLDKWNR